MYSSTHIRLSPILQRLSFRAMSSSVNELAKAGFAAGTNDLYDRYVIIVSNFPSPLIPYNDYHKCKTILSTTCHIAHATGNQIFPTSEYCRVSAIHLLKQCKQACPSSVSHKDRIRHRSLHQFSPSSSRVDLQPEPAKGSRTKRGYAR